MAMSKQTRSLVATLVVAAAGGAIVWAGYFATKASDDERKKQTESQAKAFEFEKDQVTKVALTAQGDTVAIEKRDGAWHVTAPVQARADAAAVESLVSAVHGLKARDLNAQAKPKKAPEFALAPASQAADFGLETPSFAVKLTVDAGRELELKVGDENPYDQSRPFLATGDDNLRLADSSLAFALDKNLFDLRDKALVTHETSEVFSVEVTSTNGQWAAERAEYGWRLTKPVTDKADKATVDAVLARVRNARARAFADEASPDDLAQYGLDEPVGSIVFAVGVDKARKTLQFGEVEQDGQKKAWARLLEGGPVVEVETNLLTDLSKSLDELRDKVVAAFERDAATRLEVSAGDESFAVGITRGDKGQETFSLEGDEAAKLVTWKLSSALYTLSTLKGQAIVTEELRDASAWGFDTPTATFTVSGPDGELSKIVVGKETGGTRYYAMKAGTTRVYEVEKSTVDGLPRVKADVIEQPAGEETSAAAVE